ncbi:xanthine dehydrogenase family protein subunit M [Bradyrhizobium sp. Arg237L]|uniref:FAD binding domain-containing protein n=1 Tax=Bradyrhizobium sp. Arg237L TaxID=3003352 RepID=UPI00249E48A8|nr:xanthine dehydrogenase family protein subunit M [Bradyrhizobium sp. Arg237L]MDI4236997.1 xanthine dehydrogenase family protein subunit M [Bradyrhizobium sp. Arg237L]
MKAAAFDYLRPSGLGEALALLATHKDDCKILAGGQSLVPAMNFRLARPAILIDINDLDELDYLRADADQLKIGALTRHAAFHRPVVEGPLGTLLAKVVRHIAHYPIRQRGTFAGSLSHADPASEWCLVATTLRAEMVAKSARGERVIAVADFFHGTFTTALEPDEILAEIRLPAMTPDWRVGFYEFSRRAGDFALGMAVAAARVDGGTIREARLGVGGVADRAIRLGLLEDQLVGKPASLAIIDAIAREARGMIEPNGDIHASPEYRRDLIAASVKRALTEALA